MNQDIHAKMNPQDTQQFRFRFTGTGGEYFAIWIVNLLLSIVTLGIYSAWAKVRREKYFHQHTRLAGTGFDYHGRPGAILRGRLLAVGLLGITQADFLGPWVTWGSWGLLALLLPWLTFFTIGRPLSGVVCLILQLTLIGWIPAAIWAVYALSQFKTDQKIEKALGQKGL